MSLPGTKNYLADKGNHSAFAVKAIAFEKAQVASGTTAWKDLCASLTRNSYGISAGAWGDHPRIATEVWTLCPDAYCHTYYNAPFGTAVVWSGGSSGAGHVAISDGKGNVYSNDFGPNGYIGDGRVRLIPQSAVVAHDSKLVLKGWVEIFLGVRIYSL